MVKNKDMEFYFAATDTEKLKNVFGVAENIYYVTLSASGRLKRLAIEFPKIIKSKQIDYALF